MQKNEVTLGLDGSVLYQNANRSHCQMMSYLIVTADGKLVMIDGGYHCAEDAEYLYALIKEHGGTVDAWIFTHGHDDHFGALLWLFENKENFDLIIHNIYFNFPPAEWFDTVGRGDYRAGVRRFCHETATRDITIYIPQKGDVITCDEVSLEILRDSADYEKYASVNDTSLIIRAHFPPADILFLGDLGADASADLLKAGDCSEYRCDIVQMAHHGQNGAIKEFYQAIAPKICLYPTPDWLWDNDSGAGKGSGPWATLETRRWMEELGVENSYSCADGDYIFR